MLPLVAKANTWERRPTSITIFQRSYEAVPFLASNANPPILIERGATRVVRAQSKLQLWIKISFLDARAEARLLLRGCLTAVQFPADTSI